MGSSSVSCAMQGMVTSKGFSRNTQNDAHQCKVLGSPEPVALIHVLQVYCWLFQFHLSQLHAVAVGWSGVHWGRGGTGGFVL